MRPNLRKVAELSGVGLSTASRALRDSGHVDPQTRARVLAVAQELGYVRDPALSSAMAFARRRQKPVYRETLGFLSQSLPPHFNAEVWLQRLYRGVAERAAHLGYGVECIRIPRSIKQHQPLQRQLLARGIRGIAITPVLEWNPLHLQFDWEQFASVEIGHAFPLSFLPRIERDFVEDYQMMFNRLYDLGYRRIGLAVSQADDSRRKWGILSPYLLFQFLHPELEALPPLESFADCTREGLLEWMRQVRPDVVVVNGPGPLEWLETAGIRVPESVGLCRIDCVDGSPESGLYARYEEMGLMAVNMLASRLERDEIGLPSCVSVASIANEWQNGKTLILPAKSKNS